MIKSRGPWRALDSADLHWRDNGDPYSPRFADGYSSRGDGLAESRYVFLDGNQLEERFSQARSTPFGIGELGFGTGSNFLLTRELFLQRAPRSARLHYIGTELFPLRKGDLGRALQRWPQLGTGAAELLEQYPPPVPGIHRRLFDQGRITLDLVLADTADALVDLASFDSPCVDAWFLDGFAPSRNPAMWRGEIFAAMARLSRPAATLATFSTAGAVRRGLQDAGFSLRKRSGFGSKREALQGQLQKTADARAPAMTPWDLRDRPAAGIACAAIVIGAGLAGAHAAAALARRGLQVTVLDEGNIAGRASGNPQGVLFTRLSHQRSALLDYSVLSYLFATALYGDLFRRGRLREGRDGEIGGCLQFLPARSDGLALRTALENLPELATLLNPDEARDRLGVAPASAALWMPDSGWLSPPGVCRALLGDPLISVREGCGELRLVPTCNGAWAAQTSAGETIASAERVVIATGCGTRYLSQTSNLPLKAIRGQTTQIPAPIDGTLRTSLCHRGYVSPAAAGEHCIGATFQPGDEGLDLRIEDHVENIDALGDALPDWRDYLASLEPAQLAGRAELRCASPDYLPLVGPLPDQPAFHQRFAALAQDAKQVLALRGAYLPGIYLSTAHGSRGLSYAALGAECLASQICADPAPLSRELSRAIAPARFLLRGISRGGSRGDFRNDSRNDSRGDSGGDSGGDSRSTSHSSQAVEGS